MAPSDTLPNKIKASDAENLSLALLQDVLITYSHIQRLWVAYSGGVDSLALLHLLQTQQRALGGRKLAAVHVNHGLRPEAQQWTQQCQALCERWNIEFTALRVDARPRAGESPEAAARRVRYAALAELLKSQDALLTGHHGDDQAETLLLQLLRGAGPQGLAAMPLTASLGQGLLVRPLLNQSRSEIMAYANRHQLTWLEDSSNADLGIDRNYLRHAILPSLKRRWPGLVQTLGRSARLCAETSQLLDALADADLAQVADPHSQSLWIPRLQALDVVRQRNLLRRWLRVLGLPVPSALQLQHIQRDALGARPDRQPRIHWPGVEVRRYQDRLFAMAPLLPHDASRVIPIELDEPVTIPSIGVVCLQPSEGQGLAADRLGDFPLTLRFRRGGEWFHGVGQRHGQPLKKLLQTAGISPWERERLPLLYVGDRLAAVGGHWIAREFAASPRQKGFILSWQKAPPFVNV